MARPLPPAPVAAGIGARAAPPRLIVNADDFGLNEGVNAGIARAHTAGIVTAASLMAVGRGFASALRWCRALPALDVGVHLTLVGGRALSGGDTSLADREGRFPADHRAFLRRWLAGAVRLEEVRREWAAQIERILAQGIRPSHLDSHQHLHALPGLAGLTAELARHYRIPHVRVPVDAGPWRTPRDLRDLLRLLERGALNLCHLAARTATGRQDRPAPALRFLGFQEGGRLDRARLLRLLQGLRPGGSYEMMCHPGLPSPDPELAAWHYRHGEELAALTDPGVRRTLTRLKIVLCTFRSVPTPPV